MKTISTLTPLLFLLLFNYSNAQQYKIKELLEKIDKSVNGISEGQFTLHNTISKISVGEDTTKRDNYSICFFKRLRSDSLTGYQLASFHNDGYEQLYDGNALFTLTPGDKILQITYKEKYPGKIKELNNDYFIFPFFKYLNKYIQYFNNDKMLSKVELLGIESFNGENYYKIQTNTSQSSDKNKTEAYIFISTKTFLPIRQLVKFESIIGQAKEIQIFDYWISNFKSASVPKNRFSKEILSAYNKEKLFDPYGDKNESRLLPVGAMAPNWELPLLTGSKLKLIDLKGKIIILDFWYKACAPCQKQMISLQKLHDKFEKNSVKFIGVNTVDDPIKDKLELFLKNRNITMPCVYNGKSIESLYGVYASPALFIIDKEGKILLTVDGYSDTLLEDVSNVIEQHQ